MLSLSVRLSVLLLLVTCAVIFVAGFIAHAGQVQLSVIILLVAVAVGMFNAWRNK